MVQWSFRYYMILYRLNTLKKKNVRKANYEEPWPCLPKHPIGTGDPGRSSVWPLKGASIHRKEQPGHSTGGASSRSSHLSPLSPFLKVGLERWMPQLLPSRSQGLVAFPQVVPPPRYVSVAAFDSRPNLCIYHQCGIGLNTTTTGSTKQVTAMDEARGGGPGLDRIRSISVRNKHDLEHVEVSINSGTPSS
jgi:hypothetical protein